MANYKLGNVKVLSTQNWNSTTNSNLMTYNIQIGTNTPNILNNTDLHDLYFILKRIMKPYDWLE